MILKNKKGECITIQSQIEQFEDNLHAAKENVEIVKRNMNKGRRPSTSCDKSQECVFRKIK